MSMFDIAGGPCYDHIWVAALALNCTDAYMKKIGKEPLSSTGSILSNTDLSDLSTVGSCDIFVYQMRHSHVIRPIGWFSIVYQARHHVSLKRFLWKCHAENGFKMF